MWIFNRTIIGLNVSVLCPSAVSDMHQLYMSEYKHGSNSNVIGHVRNRELRHFAGHFIPVALEIRELTSDPLVFSASISEIEQTMEALITVNRSRKIVSVSLCCPLLFGYEEQEMIGMQRSALSPGLLLREGKRVVTCQHKDSSYFVSSDIHAFIEDGQECFRGIIRRTQPSRATR